MTLLRQIRIVNESKNAETVLTRVYDGDTGAEITNVVSVALDIDANRRETLVVLKIAAEFEYVGAAQVERVRIKADGSYEPIGEGA